MALHPTLATIRRNLPRVARSLGFDARVTSGYRSRAAQTRLYNRYLQGLQSYPVAPPGTSDHEKGLALDVVSTNPDKLVSLLTEVGLFWAGPSDPVHFSLVSHQAQATREKVSLSQATAAGQSYEEAVGSTIPGFLDFLPGIGEVTSVLRNPIAAAKEGLDNLLAVILGPF